VCLVSVLGVFTILALLSIKKLKSFHQKRRDDRRRAKREKKVSEALVRNRDAEECCTDAEKYARVNRNTKIVWLHSGARLFGTLSVKVNFPADLYLEGRSARCWFSLLWKHRSQIRVNAMINKCNTRLTVECGRSKKFEILVCMCSTENDDTFGRRYNRCGAATDTTTRNEGLNEILSRVLIRIGIVYSALWCLISMALIQQSNCPVPIERWCAGSLIWIVCLFKRNR